MVKFIKKIPAGTLIVPMLISALLYTFWPSLFRIGGVTEAFLGGRSNSFIIGMLTFSSGLTIDIDTVIKLFKRHGILLLVKLALSIVLSLIFIALFGQEGIFGVTALGFVVTISSINPSLYLSLSEEYGDSIDTAAFALTALFSIPAIPLIIYAISGGGEFDVMPIISTIIPLFIGMGLRMLDKEFVNMFSGAVAVLMPILGWNIGQGMNLIDALQSGVAGIVMTVLYYLFMSPMVFVDRKLLKNDGIAPMAMISVAGSSASFPFIIAVSNNYLIDYYPVATAQILTTAIITLLATPVLLRMLNDYNQKNVTNINNK